MAIDLKSGNKIERTTIVDLQEQVSDGLNASIGQDDVSRAALGADQMYGGALCSSRQFEVLQGTIVEDHVKYPETWQGPYWGASIDWQTGSTPPTGPSASGPTFPGVNNAYERQRWQRIGGYESAGSVPGTAYGSDLHLLYSREKGCTIFFYLNLRIGQTYKVPERGSVGGGAHLWSGTNLIAGPARQGLRGWVAVVFWFKFNDAAPILTFSPATCLGGFANEFNPSSQDYRMFRDVEQIISFSETMHIDRATLRLLAFYNGYYPYEDFDMGDSDTFRPSFGWTTYGGRDAWTHQWDHGVDIDAPLYGTYPTNRPVLNGQAFKVMNGNQGFMCFDYAEENDTVAKKWLTEG